MPRHRAARQEQPARRQALAVRPRVGDDDAWGRWIRGQTGGTVVGDAASWARLAVALATVAGTVYLMVRRVDVRLVLLGAGLVMAAAAGDPLAVPDTFTRAMVAVMVGPICAALGFAAVLAATRCDRHL